MLSNPIFDIGKVSVLEISLSWSPNDSIDIMTLVTNLSLYESIFSKHTTGHLTLVDGRNLIHNLLLSGQETLKVSYKLPYDDTIIERVFRLYKISNISKDDEILQTYNMHFCEPLMFRTKEERLSKTLRGSYKDMVSKLFNDLEQDIVDMTETEGDTFQFLIPNWSINKTLDWLINNSNPVNKNSYKNSMFLYQTIDGEYHFKDMDSMLKEMDDRIFTHVPTSAYAGFSEEERNQLIIRVGKPQEFDTLRGLSTGAYASMLKVYDPIRKIEEVKLYDIKESIGRRQSQNENNVQEETRLEPLVNLDSEMKSYTENVPTTILYGNNNQHIFDNAKKLDDTEVYQSNKDSDNSKLERHALIELLNQNRLEVVVPIQTTLQVGKKIKLDLAKGEVKIGTQESSYIQDNIYLITGLSTHIDVSSSTATTNLECSKESRSLSARDKGYAERVADLLRGMS